MQYKTWLLGSMVCFVLGAGMACKKWVAVPGPEFGTGRASIFSSNETAQAAVVNMYAQMHQGTSFTNGYGSRYAALYADELQPAADSSVDQPFYNHTLTATDPVIRDFWGRAYTVIYLANAVLEGLTEAPAVTDSLRRQLIGEAYFVRALHYFYLVGFFGEVPLALTTDYYTTRALPRSRVQEVYDQIVADLQAAIIRLPDTYGHAAAAGPANIRATRWAAMGLLARVWLFRHKWQEARNMATLVIESGKFSLAGVDAVFLIHSPEIIFQLQPVLPGYNSAEAMQFLPAEKVPPRFRATQVVLDRFEAGDERRAWMREYVWENGRGWFPYKYKYRDSTPVQEYTVVLRLAELYLIRAEASARLGMLQGAQCAGQDVDLIRARAQLPALPAGMGQASVMAAIEQERAVELWAEWMHRLCDLRRWPGRNNPIFTRYQEVMQTYRPGMKYHELWPIPADQLTLNTGWQQNPGY